MEEINLQEIAEIELFILKRMKEFTLGDHASVFKGAGFNFVGIRDWEPGDRMSNIDWAQSSLNNFSPLGNISRRLDPRPGAALLIWRTAVFLLAGPAERPPHPKPVAPPWEMVRR